MSLPMTIAEPAHAEPPKSQVKRLFFIFLDFLFCLILLHGPLIIILSTPPAATRFVLYLCYITGFSLVGALHAMYMAITRYSEYENLVRSFYHATYMLACFCIIFGILGGQFRDAMSFRKLNRTKQ